MISKGIIEGIEFRESTHRYFYRGAEMVGVTTAFNKTGIVDFSMVKAEYMEPALVTGDDVHRIAQLYGELNLNEEEIDPVYDGYFEAIKKFYAENVQEVLMIEQPVCDPYNLYCGTPDIVYMNHKGEVCVDDWKTPEKPHPAWGLQTAAYKNAILKCFDGLVIKHRGGVLLRNDGTFKREEHKKSTDFDYFLAALKIARFKIEHKINT